jgi:heme/copper-type cytochrome/quinol oxidase subunit 2
MMWPPYRRCAKYRSTRRIRPGLVLRYTFTEPGVYQVLCLEYCGLAHHEMNGQIKVQ